MARRPWMHFFIGAFASMAIDDAAPAGATVDLSGTYVTLLATFFDVPCTLTFAQTGTALTIDGPCVFDLDSYSFHVDGTVDPMTGAFSTSGTLDGFCETPGSVTIIGTGDGEEFLATASCMTLSSPISGTKCGNGVIDSTETCEDGNTAAGDCCSPTCLLDAPGAPCTSDFQVCTLDQCDGDGHCQHPTAPAGTPCTSDGNQCTDDVCNASATCTHPAIGGSCDDGNACSTAETCISGTCTAGPLAPECAGSIDLTGDWEVTFTGGIGGGVGVRHFEQNGAVLTSNLGFGDGIGSVNPATGEFEAKAPFIFFIAFCTEYIDGTASSDSQTFTGTGVVDCGLDGTYPFIASGHKCAVGGPCGATPTPTRTPTPTPTPTGPPCASDVPCATPDLMSRLAVRFRGGRSVIHWRWTHSATPVDFGDPAASSDYRLCLESPGGTFSQTIEHGNGWRSTDHGFRYADNDSSVRSVSLKASSHKVVVSAGIDTTAAPALPLSTPVRMRLVRGSGPSAVCFEAEFASPSVNDDRRFRATE